jgi:hypothetical protein
MPIEQLFELIETAIYENRYWMNAIAGPELLPVLKCIPECKTIWLRCVVEKYNRCICQGIPVVCCFVPFEDSIIVSL